MDLLNDFLSRAAHLTGRDPRHGAVLALSGGPDSTALLDLHVRCAPRDRLLAVHLDHALRADSSEDRRFVCAQAAAAGIRILHRRQDVAAAAHRQGIGIEEAGRRARYALLEEAAHDARLSVIATGHHRDDQAETVLHRLLRGTGPRGLRGILPHRPVRKDSPIVVVRPLLPFRRIELEDHLRFRGIGWREDPTNQDGSNLRSLVRTRLLPALGPEAAECLADLAPPASRLYDRLCREAGSAHPDAGRPLLLREILRRQLPAEAPAPDRRTVLRLVSLLQAGHGATDLGAGWSAELSGGRFRIRGPGGAARTTITAEFPLFPPGRVELPGSGTLVAEDAAGRSPDSSPDREVIDADRAPPPYLVRSAQRRDRFRPLGLGDETTVFRFLKNRKVPREERARTWLVLSGSQVVWVVGHRIDENVKVAPETRHRILLAREFHE